jgi:hypothetical protein
MAEEMMQSYSTVDLRDKLRQRGFFENLGAQLGYQYSPAVAKTTEFLLFNDEERDPDFDWRDHVEGYEEYADEFVNAKNLNHANFIKKTITESEQRRAVISDIPWYAPSSLIAGFADPANTLFALPIAGQLGLLARGGMSLRQAATASAKGGFVAGAASELYRAPFDPVATKEEVFTNILTTTALGTALGSFPSAMRNMQPALKKAVDGVADYTTYRGELGSSYEGIKIKTGKGKSGVNYNAKKKEMTIDEAQLQTEFDQAVWTEPEVEGAAPLGEKKFLTPREYKEFLVHRFKVREDVKRNPGETNASYIDRTNKEALDRTYAGHGLKKTFYTDSVLFKAISTPGKRILRSGVPLAQRYFVLMNGNASLPSDRNTSGQGLQSIYQRQALHTARGDKALNSLRKFYDKDMGKLSEAPFIGVTYDKARAIIPGNISFDDWVSTAFEKYIAYSKIIKEPEQVAKLSDNDKQTIQLLKDFFQSYRQDAEDVGLFKSVKSINEDIEALGLKLEKKNELIDDIDRKGQQKGYTEKQQRLKKSLQKEVSQIESEIKFLETLKDEGLDRTDFYFPIYYDKKALLADEGLRQELVDVFTQHITENKDRFRFLWDEKTGQRVERNPDQTPADIAEGIVNHILKEDIDDIDYSGLPSGKHFRHRSVNIPEWKVSKFIIKRPEVLSSYSRRMGNRLEWVRNFGKQSIDDILNEVELDAIAKDKSDQDIANLRADMLGEYERLMGILSKSPDRIDAQVVKATKDLAGMTFLHSAGIASITDAGSIILEHGIGKVFNDAVLKSGTKGFQLAAAEVKKITVGADIIQGHGIRRVVNDDVRRINPNTVERIFNPITNAFYNIPIIGNSLGVVTRFGKIIDAVLRQNHLIDLSKRYDSLDIMDIEYLARYGIDRDTARQFADLIDNEVIQQVDGFYLSNIDKWPSATLQDRDLIRKFETAMNSGTANTIMHATGFDKPLMMDGVMYVNHKPWMDALGFKIDERASTKNIKKVRLESQVMTMPFQFMNFALAANNRITGAMMDPHRKYRIQSVISLMALSYISLQLKKPDWWFENKSNTEIFMRTVDASGVLGVYSDIGYMGLHMLIGSGVYDQEEGVIQGKYRPTPFAAFTEPLGAGPGLIADWTIGLKDLFDGGDTEAAERLKYLLPIWPLFGLREDMQDAAGALITGK